MKMKIILIAAVIITLLISGCRGVVVTQPEAPQATIIPASPGPTYVWVGDSWRWNGQVYVIERGHWVKPKRNRVVWVDGRWVKTRGGWRYVEGHWERR
jgi:hypothetical protein